MARSEHTETRTNFSDVVFVLFLFDEYVIHAIFFVGSLLTRTVYYPIRGEPLYSIPRDALSRVLTYP